MPTHPQGPAQGRAFYQSTRALPHQRMQVTEGPQGRGADDTEYIAAPPAAYGNAAPAGAQAQGPHAERGAEAGVTIKPHSMPSKQALNNA